MINRLAVLLGCLALAAAAQTSSFPATPTNDAQLKVQVNGRATLLSGSMNASATSAIVASCTGIPANSLATVNTEIIAIANCSGNTLTLATASPGCTNGRACDGTTAATHSAGATLSLFVDAWHHNALRVEVEAIEASLGVGASPTFANVTAGTGTFTTLNAGTITGGAGALTVTSLTAGTGTFTTLNAGGAGSLTVTSLTAGTGTFTNASVSNALTTNTLTATTATTNTLGAQNLTAEYNTTTAALNLPDNHSAGLPISGHFGVDAIITTLAKTLNFRDTAGNVMLSLGPLADNIQANLGMTIGTSLAHKNLQLYGGVLATGADEIAGSFINTSGTVNALYAKNNGAGNSLKVDGTTLLNGAAGVAGTLSVQGITYTVGSIYLLGGIAVNGTTPGVNGGTCSHWTYGICVTP
jgi:hypothetical protein